MTLEEAIREVTPVLTLPEELKGSTRPNCGYTNTTPRTWTPGEIAFIQEKKKAGYSVADIAKACGRSEVSISIKLKRLQKSGDSYNEQHRAEKYQVNKQYLEAIKPESVLDCFCGVGSFYHGKVPKVTTNDLNKEIEADLHLPALKCLCKFFLEGKKFDVVDLDPFGSAADCFDLAIKLARKGLVVTFGEMGHKRWKRLDYVSRFYDITSLEEFTTENLIRQVQKIGQQNHKELVVLYQRDWPNISRVWFEVKPAKEIYKGRKNEDIQ